MNRWFAASASVILAVLPAEIPADEPVSPQQSGQTQAQGTLDDADLRAGDRAFAQRDYPVAVSFYTKYLQLAEKSADQDAVKTAYERLMDALVMSRLTPLAETRLAEYEKRFPHGKETEIAMWRGDILYQKGKYREAGELYRKLLSSLPLQDPRRLRTLFACAQVLEKQGQWKAAATQYEPLSRQAAGTQLGRQSFLRLILCLASDGQCDRAWDLLLANPPADRAARDHYSLLAAYITLKQSGAEAASGAWRNLAGTFRDGSNPLIYLVASTYGDAMTRINAWPDALMSYRAAFHAASDKNEMFETLNRMVEVISQTGDKAYAARLAMSQLDLFKDSLLNSGIKLRTARLLRDAGSTKGALELYESVFANMNSTDQERFQAIYEYSMLLAQTGRLAEAEKTIRNHFRAQKESDGEFLLAEIMVRLNLPDRYCSQYRKIAERWPDKAKQACMLAARACLDGRQPDRAMDFLNRLRHLPQVDPVHLLYLDAVTRMQKNQKGAALKLFNDFLKQAKPWDELLPDALYQSGLLAFFLQDTALAAERLGRFRKAYPRHPLAPQAAAWLVQIYLSRNDEVAAERESWRLAEQYPASEYALDAQFRLAAHYAEEGSKDKAEGELKKLAENSRFPAVQARALYVMALQAVRRGERKTALSLLNTLYEKFPDSAVLPEAYYLHGDILRKESDFKSAVPFYQKVTALRPNSALAASAYGSIGDSLLAIASADPVSSKNELNSAVQSYQSMLDQRDCPPAFSAMGSFRMGRCLFLLGQREQASEQFRQLLYKYPAAGVKSHPVEMVWCVRAAEALIDIAARQPIRSTLEYARTALHWLTDAGLIPRSEASDRFEKLKKTKFNP